MPKRKCSNVDKTFGKNIAEYRKQCGFTQQQVADMLSLNRTTYTKYETGASEPSIEIMRKIASIFGVDINTLLDIDSIDLPVSDSSMPLIGLTKDEQDLIGLFRMFTDDEKLDVINHMIEIKEDKNNPYT